MAILIDPTLPTDTESPRQGASRIRALTLQMLQLLTEGGGAAVSFSAAPFNVDGAGNVTIPVTISVPTPMSPNHAVTKAYVDAKLLDTILYNGSSGGTNTYTTTLAPTPVGFAELTGVPIAIKFSNANTGAATLNPNGLGAKAIVKSGSALSAGDILANSQALLIYDGAAFQLLPLGRDVQGVISSFPVAANEKWMFRWELLTNEASGPSVATVNLAAPTGATLQWGTALQSSGFSHGGTNALIISAGTVTNGATAGSVTVSLAGATIVAAILTAVRIA